MTTDQIKIRTRVDGVFSGQAFTMDHDLSRTGIAGLMGWQDGGDAVGVITRTLDLLAEGKAVKLTSRHGYCEISPLGDDEDGRQLPRSSYALYDPNGVLVRRLVRGPDL